MKPQFSTLMLAAALAACGSKPVPPAWQANAYSSVTSFTSAYLRGESSVADTEFARARSEMASTGRPDLVAKVELVRCAARVAALDIGDCPGYQAVALDASAEERAYAAYIAGRFAEVDVAALPEQHRPVLASGSIVGVADPLGRLVAAGALLQAGRLTPADLTLAVDTASSQGWRRPLLAWLGVQLKRAQAAGDSAAAALIQRRIDLAGASP